MHTRTHKSLTLAIVATLLAAGGGYATAASAAPAVPSNRTASMLQEIPDPELATMRGRFIIGSNTVAYFGVTMASSWVTSSGQTLTGAAVLGMHFGAGSTPVITFTPTMNIVQGAAIPAASPGGVVRSVDGSGLASVNGLLQGIQVAGDGNRAVNVTSLRISQGADTGSAAAAAPASAPGTMQMTSGDARVAIAFNPDDGVEMTLGIVGQGLVSQWIRNSGVGQLVQLTADGQSVSNQLQLNLVLGSAAASSQALHAASAALLQARAVGAGG
ncbi:MAG: hypothetical protein EPN38_02300 [Rhodanobacteraceae bacterium]|nr:MAG: hypothetical protein EPN38_02300 [Rhodanobacteraceae bacterium]